MIKVWNMHSQEWVELKEYMRYCPFIWTKGVDWLALFPKTLTVVK